MAFVRAADGQNRFRFSCALPRHDASCSVAMLPGSRVFPRLADRTRPFTQSGSETGALRGGQEQTDMKRSQASSNHTSSLETREVEAPSRVKHGEWLPCDSVPSTQEVCGVRHSALPHASTPRIHSDQSVLQLQQILELGFMLSLMSGSVQSLVKAASRSGSPEAPAGLRFHRRRRAGPHLRREFGHVVHGERQLNFRHHLLHSKHACRRFLTKLVEGSG